MALGVRGFSPLPNIFDAAEHHGGRCLFQTLKGNQKGGRRKGEEGKEKREGEGGREGEGEGTELTNKSQTSTQPTAFPVVSTFIT